MATAGRKDWTDGDLLEALHLADNEGLSAAKIAAHLGRTRMAVIGRLNRVRQNTGASEHDGTMPPRWWENGGDLTATR